MIERCYLILSFLPCQAGLSFVSISFCLLWKAGAAFDLLVRKYEEPEDELEGEEEADEEEEEEGKMEDDEVTSPSLMMALYTGWDW